MDLEQFKISGKYLMFAFDHRGSFKKMIRPENPDSLTDQEVIELKKEIIDSIDDQFSGILIDIPYGLPAYTKKDRPYLLPLEKTGYKDESGERITELERSVDELKGLGAKGAKLLIYFCPDIKSAKKQLETAKKVVMDCKAASFPLFLEIVTYLPGDDQSSEQRARLVKDSVKMFLDNGVAPDVFKLEYPGDEESCQEITGMLGEIPWIILTRGVSFDRFVPQLEAAIRSGAVGFLAGRALWKEVCEMNPEDRKKFLTEVHPERFRKICQIATT